jgi:quinol-cytochrome oxidoreductase complex cytochrome b subunit
MAAINYWIINRDIYKDYDNDTYPLSQHRYLQKRNKYAWWIGFIYVYGMIDAVVDAHLHNFDHLMASPLKSEKKGEIIDAE